MKASLPHELFREVIEGADELLLHLRPWPTCSQRIDILWLFEGRQTHPE